MRSRVCALHLLCWLPILQTACWEDAAGWALCVCVIGAADCLSLCVQLSRLARQSLRFPLHHVCAGGVERLSFSPLGSAVMVLPFSLFAASVLPAPLPSRMLWRLTLVEHHPSVKPNASDEAFGNYYFDWSAPDGIVSVRQENSIAYAPWRSSIPIPWNNFYGVNGKLATVFLNSTKALPAIECRPLPLSYGPEFWPRDFLTSQCVTLHGGQSVPMPTRFGGRFYDGRLAIALQCQIGTTGGIMQINPVLYIDSRNGQVLRFDLTTYSPGWNAQTWDILEQRSFDSFDNHFMAMPEICTTPSPPPADSSRGMAYFGFAMIGFSSACLVCACLFAYKSWTQRFVTTQSDAAKMLGEPNLLALPNRAVANSS